MGPSGRGVGGATATTSGTNSSTLSISAAPPKNTIDDYITLGVLGLGILGMIVGILSDGVLRMIGLGIIGGFVGGLIGLGYYYLSEARTRYAQTFERWTRVRMCLRCGVFYSVEP